jgi:ribosomal RNA-processing protein 17
MGGPSAKRRKLSKSSNAPAEVVFDDESRADYLTGFHKRKVARAKEAQTIAARLAKEEKIKDRAEVIIHKRCNTAFMGSILIADFVIVVDEETA